MPPKKLGSSRQSMMLGDRRFILLLQNGRTLGHALGPGGGKGLGGGAARLGGRRRLPAGLRRWRSLEAELTQGSGQRVAPGQILSRGMVGEFTSLDRLC